MSSFKSIAAAAVIAAVNAQDGSLRSDPFLRWAEQNNKHYGTQDEYDTRRNIFGANAKLIEAHNAAAAAGKVSWQVSSARTF